MMKPQILGLLNFALTCVALPPAALAATPQTINILLQARASTPRFRGWSSSPIRAK